MTTSRMLVLLSLVALAAAPPSGAAICKKKSGVIAFRDACRKKEVEVDPAQLGLTGPKGDPGPPGQGQPRMFLTDAEGTRLPGFMNGAGQLVYPFGGRAFGLRVGVDGFPDVAFFNYESADCTGPRLVFAGDDVAEFGNVLGGVLHYAGEPAQMRTFSSTANATRADQCTMPDVYDAATKLCCRTNPPQEAELAPALTVDLRNFVPPFTLEIEQ